MWRSGLGFCKNLNLNQIVTCATRPAVDLLDFKSKRTPARKHVNTNDITASLLIFAGASLSIAKTLSSKGVAISHSNSICIVT